MIMKKHLTFQYLIVFLVLGLLTGCHREGSEIPRSNVATPEWQVSSDYDYSTSMTVVAEVDLTTTYPELTPKDWQVDTNDLLAAFAGEECIGVTSPVDSLFFLYITAPSQENEVITLWYYSSRLCNIFQASTVLQFVNGARHGSVSNPLRPSFEEWKKQ